MCRYGLKVCDDLLVLKAKTKPPQHLPINGADNFSNTIYVKVTALGLTRCYNELSHHLACTDARFPASNTLGKSASNLVL